MGPLQIRILWFGIWQLLSRILRTSLWIRIPLLGLRGYYRYKPHTMVTIGGNLSHFFLNLLIFIPPLIFQQSNNYPPKILKYFKQTSSLGQKNFFVFFLKRDPCKVTSSVLLFGYNIQLSDRDIVGNC